jgi:membrane associated rhomboid family serine protease
MGSWDTSSSLTGLPKPGKVVIAVLILLFTVWLMFAMAVNWGGASLQLFELFCGNQQAILDGQLWRLVTAAFMHEPSGSISHILWAMLGFYFLTPSLEQKFGSARLGRFLVSSAVFAYTFQFVCLLVLPTSVGARLVGNQYWFGAFPVLEAVAVAWALNFPDQQIRLFLFLPASSRTLIWMVVGLSVLRIVAQSHTPEGLLSPFGGMLAGWLMGGGTPSPLRRLYLSWKLSRLEQETERSRGIRSERVRKANLRVVPGGKSDKQPRDPKDWLN